MVPEDREVLLRLRAANQNLGNAVVEVLGHQDAGGIEAFALRGLADGLENVLADLRALADAKEGVIDNGSPVVIDVAGEPHDSRQKGIGNDDHE